MKKLFLNFILLCFLFAPVVVNAQSFAGEIADFKKADSLSFPFAKQHPILFVGSSSFRKWTDIQNYFPGYPIINRGFGGSLLTDVIFYADDIIFPYHPKQIVIYCGENDLAASDSISAKIVLQRFIKLFSIIRNKLPHTSIAFVSIKPSPARQSIQPKVVQANTLIKNFLNSKKRAVFIDVYHAMLNTDGTMKKELFLEDDLHMNAKGYAIWQRIIQPSLLKFKK